MLEFGANPPTHLCTRATPRPLWGGILPTKQWPDYNAKQQAYQNHPSIIQCPEPALEGPGLRWQFANRLWVPANPLMVDRRPPAVDGQPTAG